MKAKSDLKLGAEGCQTHWIAHGSGPISWDMTDRPQKNHDGQHTEKENTLEGELAIDKWF